MLWEESVHKVTVALLLKFTFVIATKDIERFLDINVFFLQRTYLLITFELYVVFIEYFLQRLYRNMLKQVLYIIQI